MATPRGPRNRTTCPQVGKVVACRGIMVIGNTVLCIEAHTARHTRDHTPSQPSLTRAPMPHLTQNTPKNSLSNPNHFGPGSGLPRPANFEVNGTRSSVK